MSVLVSIAPQLLVKDLVHVCCGMICTAFTIRFRHGLLRLTVTLIALSTTSNLNAQTACSNSAESLDHWRSIRQQADTIDGNEHASALANCLSSPNPELRDVIAYEVLTYWLRRNTLSSDTRTGLIARLTPHLADGEGSAGDPHAVARAFAALILSELVRADALDSIMSPQELGVLSTAAVQMFEAERDYRGLDEELGWIHTIAHGADLLFRLAAHTGTNKAQHERYLAALSQQIAREDVPAYVFNEADRLGRVASTVSKRGLVGQEQFDTWVASLAEPGSLAKWNNAFRSPQGMARLHNVKQFLRALREQLANAEQDHAASVVESQLRKLP